MYKNLSLLATSGVLRYESPGGRTTGLVHVGILGNSSQHWNCLNNETANLNNETANLNNETESLKSETASLKSETANPKSRTASLKNETASLKSETANPKSGTANPKSGTEMSPVNGVNSEAEKQVSLLEKGKMEVSPKNETVLLSTSTTTTTI